jgi:hypothetical protein
MEAKLSTYKPVRELQLRCLALAKVVGTETKQLEVDTEKRWEESKALIKTATDLFTDTDT